MLLAVDAYPSTKGDPVRHTMERLFSEHGLPRSIRSDNGAPFASAGVMGLSALSAWWLSIGVSHERIEVGHPEQNGRHERMHLTLKQETTRPAAATFDSQQERFDRFRTFYNTERPHEALGQQPPRCPHGPRRRARSLPR
jgi:transposase InsO family protein